MTHTAAGVPPVPWTVDRLSRKRWPHVSFRTPWGRDFPPRSDGDADDTQEMTDRGQIPSGGRSTHEASAHLRAGKNFVLISGDSNPSGFPGRRESGHREVTLTNRYHEETGAMLSQRQTTTRRPPCEEYSKKEPAVKTSCQCMRTRTKVPP